MNDYAPTATAPDTTEPLIEQPTRELLIRQLDDANARLAVRELQLTEARYNHESDIQTLGEALLTEANNRDWCSEYDYFVTRVNRDLHSKLPDRERDYTVVVTASITVKVRATGTDNAHTEAERIALRLERLIDSQEDVETSSWDSDYDIEESDD